MDAGSIPTPASKFEPDDVIGGFIRRSEPRTRSARSRRIVSVARMVKLVDTRDLKSLAWVTPACRFDSGSGHHLRYHGAGLGMRESSD